MRLSKYSLYNWLRAKMNINTICKKITYSGLEVEEITNNVDIGKNIIIGNIIFCKQHPNSSTYIVLKVDIGNDIYLNIVSNKKNFHVNMKVVVARNGAILSNNTVVKSIKLHGIVSEGIICHFNHLNMFSSKNDFIELPMCAPIGLNFQDYYFYKDSIIKINITPNRLDALGVVGIAREISIINNWELPRISNIPVLTNIKEICNFNLDIPNLVCSYTGRIIKNINLKAQTPIWMKEKLRRCRIDSINIVADIVNYIFIEFGKSLYVFSFLNELCDIFLRFAYDSEKIYINNNTIILNNKIIVLSNKLKILSFLGSIDFDCFPVNLNFTNILISFVFIEPEISNTSINQLRNNNCNIKKNEYYIDTCDQKNIIEYTTNLFLTLCGGDVGPITSYISGNYYQYINRKIYVDYSNIKRMTGCNISYDIIISILQQLQYLIEFKENKCWCVIPPCWRLDILIEEDVISDIIRIYKYENISLQPICINNHMYCNNINENNLKRVKYLLIDHGYNEVINYSFVDPKIQNVMFPNKNFLFLKNPISIDMSCMRYSLLPGLIKNTLYHQNRQYEEIKFFESGLCFLPDHKENLGVQQCLYLSGIIGNIFYKNYWDNPARIFDFYDIKGDVESIFDVIGYLDNIEFKRIDLSYLHPEQSVSIFLNNKCIGLFGTLHPILLNLLNLQYSVFVFEIFWNRITLQGFDNIKNISEFPVIKRDISILINQDIAVNDIIIFCKKQMIHLLRNIKIFDIYTGHTIPYGKKSVSLTLIFQSIKRTLEDHEIDQLIQKFLKDSKEKFNAVLRCL